MKIKRIICFIESPFTQRDYDRLGIELLQKNGFAVDVWDYTPLFHPNVYERVTVPDPIEYERYRCFRSKEEALNEIYKLHNDAFIIFFIGYYPRAFSLYRAVSKSNLNYAVFMANALPLPEEKRLISILRKYRNITPRKLYNYILSRIPFASLGIKSATFCLASGRKSKHYRYPVDEQTTTLWIHTLDYDLYLKERNRETEKAASNIAVFLDEYLPFHSDYIHQNILPPTSPEEYYPLLCDYFDFLEKEYNLKVVIAAHPRAKYDEHPDFYGGREVIQYRTVELVRNSAFVILHASTAINFAILFNKPCVFVTTNKLQDSSMGPYINKLASLLGNRPICLDEEWDGKVGSQLYVNHKAYLDYRHNYIKKEGTEDSPFWQIFADAVKQLS